MLKTNYRETVLQKVRRLRNIILGIVGFCIAFIAAGMGILLYYGYITNGNSTSVYMMLPGFLIFIGLAVFMRSFFKGYLEVIEVMTDEDLETMERLGKTRWWMEKQLPSFIIYSGKIRVFKLYSQPDFSFTELSEISIRPNYFSRGRQNKLVIFKKAKGGSFFFGMDSNPAQEQHLVDKALEYNPDIIIKNR
ncbi:hypothetical protein [Chryseobacterium camelliae]|uniref:hypothetical protein n=1 Tax=Chryseobacterium camelliae TaxID=1265445 RepID=UPI00285BBE62|nr:hypothetical protein [Chryseobacterium camelliae]MDR6514726.1 Zn-dependent protease with chaperone function [Chryseobacterium camelliae]